MAEAWIIDAVRTPRGRGKKDSGSAWVLWVAIAGIAKTVAVATSSIAGINPFRVFTAMAVMPK